MSQTETAPVLPPVASAALETLGNPSEGHARLSPSGSKKWMACAGSIVLESFVPNESSSYADDGTACHEVSAACLATPPANADDWVNKHITVSRPSEPERKVRFTDEMADISQQYIGDIRAKTKGHKLWVETRVDFSEWVGVANQSGTLDAAALIPIDGNPMLLEANVDDLKSGRTPVEVESNPQLMTYALGFMSFLGAEHCQPSTEHPEGAFELMDGRKILRVRLSIHQPKLHPGPIEWTCSPADLVRFADTLRFKAARVEAAAKGYGVIPIATWNEMYLNPKPNSEECAFCRAMATCPKVAAEVQEATGAAFDAIAEDGLPPVAPQALDDDDLGVKMAATDLIEDWIKSVRGEVERRLLAGTEVPGFGLELGRKGNRKFSDEVEAERLLRDKFQLRHHQIYDSTLKSPTQIAKLAKPQKVDGVEVAPLLGPRRWPQIEALIAQSDPKPSVKPASKIKTPYTVPAVTADAFTSLPESQDEEQLF